MSCSGEKLVRQWRTSKKLQGPLSLGRARSCRNVILLPETSKRSFHAFDVVMLKLETVEVNKSSAKDQRPRNAQFALAKVCP